MESTSHTFFRSIEIATIETNSWPIEGKIITTEADVLGSESQSNVRCDVYLMPLYSPLKQKGIISNTGGFYVSQEISKFLTLKTKGFQNMIGLSSKNGTVYCVLERPQGQPLKNYLRNLSYCEKKIPKKFWLDLVMTISRFQKCYNRPHGSLNPKDIYVSNNGDCTIGFPERLNWNAEKSEATENHDMYDLYMSPEQKVGEKCGFEADVFALCTVFYYILNNCCYPPKRKILDGFTFQETSLDAPIPSSVKESELYKLVKDVLLKKKNIPNTRELFDLLYDYDKRSLNIVPQCGNFCEIVQHYAKFGKLISASINTVPYVTFLKKESAEVAKRTSSPFPETIITFKNP